MKKRVRLKKHTLKIIGTFLFVTLTFVSCLTTANASELTSTDLSLWFDTVNISEPASTNLSPWYNTVLENNLQKRQEWREQKYDYMDPSNYLNMNDPEMKDLSDEIVKGCTTDYEKVKAIHDWVCNNIYYDFDAYHYGFGMATFSIHNDKEERDSITMSPCEWLLSYKRGVCSYYASTFSVLVRAQGIPCMVVSGIAINGVDAWDSSGMPLFSYSKYRDRWTSENYDKNDTNHAWNEVYVDGHWMIVDTTWDSLNVYHNGIYTKEAGHETYFDISDEDFALNHKILKYPDPDVPKHYIRSPIAVIASTSGTGVTHGSISVLSQASVAQTVIITIEPDPGYQLEDLIVIEDGGNKIFPVSKLAGHDNQYSFVMPDNDVKISVSFCKELQTTVAGFLDVPKSAYFASAVIWAEEEGITRGTTLTNFSPYEVCSQAQVLTFLWRAAESPLVEVTVPFKMNGNEYYYDAVKWAYKNSIIGIDFTPDIPCTRSSAVTYIWKAFNSPSAPTDNPFIDVANNVSYAQAVIWAVENGITSGTTNCTFNPDDICNRGQIVTFLYRAYTGKNINI